MLNVIKYGAVSSKTRAMYGRLLDMDDYRELIHKKTVSDIVSYLKHNTHFKAVLSDVDENEIHRGSLENILKQDLVNDYIKLAKFTNGQIKKFIHLMFTKVEIESLKIIFRIFEAGGNAGLVLGDSRILNIKYDNLDLSKLAMAKDLEQFINELKGTEYYNVLRPFAHEDNETRLFSMEMALDLFYLRTVHDEYKKLKDSNDRKLIREYAGLESDIFNIFWIYRSKTFYNMDNEVIKSYTLPLIYKLNKAAIDAMIKARNFDEFISAVKATPYAFLFDKGNKFFEQSYSEFMYQIHRKRFRTNPFSIACVVSYLRLKEVELSNIISIIEGVRYKLSEDNIKNYVIGMKS